MKYASERGGGMATSVHDWKPCPADRFSKLLHQYTTSYGCEWGHGGLTMTAMKLDQTSTCTIFYYPKDGKPDTSVRSPVLMTVEMQDGKIVCFESLKYGFVKPTIIVTQNGMKVYDDRGNNRASIGISGNGDMRIDGTLSVNNIAAENTASDRDTISLQKVADVKHQIVKTDNNPKHARMDVYWGYELSNVGGFEVKVTSLIHKASISVFASSSDRHIWLSVPYSGKAVMEITPFINDKGYPNSKRYGPQYYEEITI